MKTNPLALMTWIACVSLFALPLAAQTTTTTPATAPATARFDVRKYGAVGDGHTHDTAAFQKALDACSAAGGGIVLVPGGARGAAAPRGNYLIGSIELKSNTTLQLDGSAAIIGSPDIADYPLVKIRWEGEYAQGHRALISAENADHISIIGRGSIYGPPVNLSRLRNPRGPALIELTSCTNATLDGFSTLYQTLWSIHPLLCRNLTIRNLVIRSIGANGDGIDLDSCSDVQIERCNIDTGDDAIAIKSGRGFAAQQLNRPTEKVSIRDCSLLSSNFAGLAIGSEISGGVRDVHIDNCVVAGRQNAIFIKSRDGRGGYITDITGENLTVRDSPTFIAFSLIRTGIQATDPVPGDLAQWTPVKNITFKNIAVDNIGDLILARGVPPQMPVDGLTLTNIKGNCDHAFILTNMKNVALSDIHVTGYQAPYITKTNVTGTGLDEPN